MAKRADFTIEPDLMKGEIDEHGKLRGPFVRLPGEPDHWMTFYLKVGDRVCYDYSRRSARRRMVIALGSEAVAKRAGPDRRPEWACSRAGSLQGKALPSWNQAKILQ
jgi:hypothetical protein